MPSPTEISVEQLSRIIGLPGAPMLIDVRPSDGDGGDTDQSRLPTARRMASQTVSNWAHNFSGQRVVVYCRNGGSISQGTAAWLRQAGINAETLAGGFDAWCKTNQLQLSTNRLPVHDEVGRTT